jgi:hypothetical protein
MLVYYFGHVNGTLEQVSTAISAAEGEVSVWARMAYRKGEELRTRIDPGSFIPAKEVEILLGRPMGRSGSVIIPMDWKATGVEALFPVMSADLVLQPLGPGLVEVIFRGSYEPPLKGLGRLLDRAVLHRLAEASAKAFLDQLCRAVEDSIASDGQENPDGGSAPGTSMESGVASGFFSSTPETRQA